MKLRHRQPASEPEPDDDEPGLPTLGVHPHLDMLAVQEFILRQQATVFRHQSQLYRMIRWQSVLYAFLALLWLVVSFEPLARLLLRR